MSLKTTTELLDAEDVLYAVRQYTQATYRLYERQSPAQQGAIRAHLVNDDGKPGGMVRDIHEACGDEQVQGLMRTGLRPHVADPEAAMRLAVHLRAIVSCAPYHASDAKSAEVSLRDGPRRFTGIHTHAGWRALFRALRANAEQLLSDDLEGAR